MYICVSSYIVLCPSATYNTSFSTVVLVSSLRDLNIK